ncbi:hypothetical protein HPB50_008653 [Hyalomma asiaticum]|uniref:Uncharacterized protein n=1 Tax=Hyalomma asiaticum TaxID=266040 RepID=A0ACB7TGT0_HYAAI|nr:hypothetical protein HPB50_008653 [Hyalomma asiaticum]
MEAASWSIRDSKRDTTDDSGVEDSAATVAEVASWTRSASWARRSRVKSPAAARTRRVDCGKRCTKSSLNSAPFESTSLVRRSCRMLLSSWEGRRSPSSSLALIVIDGTCEGAHSLLELKETQLSENETILSQTPDTTLCIAYSSGTTGFPKGVQLTHRNLIVQVIAFGYTEPVFERGDSYLCSVAIMHIGGFWSLFCYLGLGSKVVVLDTTDVGLTLSIIEKYKVVDFHTRQTLGPNQEGEVCAKSPASFKAYLNQPKATDDAYEDGFVRTGDKGYYTADGCIFLCGRFKELIKCMDQQVYPAELEELLAADPEVRHVVVAGIPHAQYGEAARAFVVHWRCLTDPLEQQREAERLKQVVADRLAYHKHLHGGLEFLDNIPESDYGKGARKLLAKAYVDRCHSSKESGSPMTSENE